MHNDNHISDRQANEYFEKGLKYATEGGYGEARIYFFKADRKCPNVPVILNAIGNCYTNMNLPDSGAPYYEKAIEILELGLARHSPYHIDRHMLLLNLARSYYFQHNKNKALELLDSISADPVHDEVYYRVVEFEKEISKAP